MSSDQQGGDDEPLSMRQKRGGDETVPVIIALGGPMYDEATARKMLEEAVLVHENLVLFDNEDESGFDPNDAALDNIHEVHDLTFGGNGITPMIYFAHEGDVKMCRYLTSRGASTTKRSPDNVWSPMEAAVECGHLEVCKVLHANGAKNDIWKEDVTGFTPFQNVAGLTPFYHATYAGHDELLRWLVLQGALCADDNSEEVVVDRIYPRNYRGITQVMSRTCDRLVEWAAEVTLSHSSMVMFLLGILPPAPGTDQSCILQCLSGHNGVRKHIADFVGLEVTKGKHLRILRNVKDVLPSFYQD